jgi:hypothetical protein
MSSTQPVVRVKELQLVYLEEDLFPNVSIRHEQKIKSRPENEK